MQGSAREQLWSVWWQLHVQLPRWWCGTAHAGGCGGRVGQAEQPGWLVSLRPHRWARGDATLAWEQARCFDGGANLQLSTCLTAL